MLHRRPDITTGDDPTWLASRGPLCTPSAGETQPCDLPLRLRCWPGWGSPCDLGTSDSASVRLSFPVTLGHCGPLSSLCSRRQPGPHERIDGQAQPVAPGWGGRALSRGGLAARPSAGELKQARGRGPGLRLPRTHAAETTTPQASAHPSPSRNKRAVSSRRWGCPRPGTAGPTSRPDRWSRGPHSARRTGAAGGPRTGQGAGSQQPRAPGAERGEAVNQGSVYRDSRQ